MKKFLLIFAVLLSGCRHNKIQSGVVGTDVPVPACHKHCPKILPSNGLTVKVD